MAQYGSIAAGKYSGMTPPVPGEARVAHRVHAAMNAVQPVRLEGPRDMALGKSQLAQLLERHHSMLSFRQLAQSMMRTPFNPANRG